MFPIRMKHPDHGFMHAYNTAEVAKLRGLGWAPEDEFNVPVVGVDKDGDGVIDQAFKKKPGRPKKA
jgi:hypothetical protein